MRKWVRTQGVDRQAFRQHATLRSSRTQRRASGRMYAHCLTVWVESLIFSAQITLLKYFTYYTFYLAECITIFYRVNLLQNWVLFFSKVQCFIPPVAGPCYIYKCVQCRCLWRCVSLVSLYNSPRCLGSVFHERHCLPLKLLYLKLKSYHNMRKCILLARIENFSSYIFF